MKKRSWGIPAGIVNGLLWFNSRQEKDDSLLHRTQNDYGFHPASHPMGTGGSFPGSVETVA
jgi:hypothetical protein